MNPGCTIRRWLQVFPRSRRARLLWLGVLPGCCALIFAAEPARAQAARPSEYQVKAVYLYNFGKFVAWPRTVAAPANSPFVICVLGEDPFGPALDSTLAGESVAGKPAQVRRITRQQDSAGCEIVFVSASEERRLPSILAYLDGQHILTVSEMNGFADRGGMIQFVTEEGRVRFEVNLAAAARAGLTLSADLLKVATRVRQ